MLEGNQVPDANEEYLLYQTLVGAWPLHAMDEADYEIFVQRMAAYMEKALKEAKVHTSWVNPNVEYDAAVSEFVKAVLKPGDDNRFLPDLHALREQIEYPAMCNGLSQLVLKLSVPGVPDFYQGTELWNFSLVDPDNRRPVDYGRRREALEEIQQREQESLDGLLEDLHSNWRDGRIKLYVTYRGLNFRRERLPLFLHGDYERVDAAGDRARHVCAFLRRHDKSAILTVVPRLIHRLGGSPMGDGPWSGTRLQLPDDAPRRWRNLFTGETCNADASGQQPSLEVAALLRRFPVGLFEAVDGQ